MGSHGDLADAGRTPGAESGGPVMVTGGRGFVGRWIVDRMVEAGRPVVTYDRDPWPGREGVTAVHGELHDLPRLLSTIEEHGVRRVIHTAGISHPDTSVEMPTATFFANTMGTLQVFEAARLSGLERVVNFSTSSIYGHQPGPVVEDLCPAPITPYGVSKVATEMLGRVYRSLYGVDVISLRVFWVYGPGNRMPEYSHDLIVAALAGEEYRLDSGAEHPLPLVHADDIARAAILAIDCPEAPAGVYNVVGREQPTLAELADRIAALIPEARFEIGPGYLHLHQLGDVNGILAAREIGYEPLWELDHGLENYVAHLREHEA